MRVVVYAEGGLDDSRGSHTAAPGEPLPEPALGVVHILTRRCLAGVIPDEVVFEAPLNPGARALRGSRLLHCPSLRRALAWPSPSMTPDLALVFVDADGDRARRARINDCLERRAYPHPPVVVAISVNEIEAWLIADHGTVQQVLGQVFDQAPAPETLGPGEAKGLLAGWVSQVSQSASARIGVRRTIASECDLALVARVCPAFSRFMSDLKGACQLGQ